MKTALSQRRYQCEREEQKMTQTTPRLVLMFDLLFSHGIVVHSMA